MDDSLFKILLVDDQQFVLDGLIEQLNWDRFHGILCGSASDGISALEIMNNNRPDVIISDIKMQRMDGLKLAKSIEETPKFTGIPMILLSGYRDFEYAKEALKYHVKDYILKPITRKKLEQLENILIGFYNNRETSKAKLKELTTNNYQRELTDALKKQDICRIENFFHSSFFNESMNSKYCDIIGAQILSLLYNHLEDIHFNKEQVDISRSHTFDNYYNLPTTSAKLNLIETTYLDFLTTINHQKSSNTDSLFRYSLRYIEQHYTDSNFNISYLASEMNISLSYLSTLFKQHAGINIASFLSVKRLAYAKNLLSTPRFSIRSIAKMSGYDDPGYFSYVFKKNTGMSPTEYRNCHI